MGVWGEAPHPLFFGIGMYLYKLEEDEVLLEELMASKKVIHTSRGPLWFEFPRSDDILFARHVYDSKYEQYKRDGTPTVEEAQKEHEENGLWGEDDEATLKRISDMVEETANKLATEINRARKKKYEDWIQRLERKLAELYDAKVHLFSNTAEALASDASHAYIAYKCFRTPSGHVLWESFEEMMESWEDRAFVVELMRLVMQESEPPEISIIRKLARSANWRLRWNVVKKNPENLFSRRMVDLTIAQTLLVYWSQVYDSAYESLERPPQEIINDDIEFDKWLEKESKEREREVGQKYYGKGKNPQRKNSKIDNSPEVYNIVEGYYNDEGVFVRYTEEERWEQIERMRNLNTADARAVQRGVEKKLGETPHLVQPEQRLKDKHGIEATGGSIIKKGKGR